MSSSTTHSHFLENKTSSKKKTNCVTSCLDWNQGNQLFVVCLSVILVQAPGTHGCLQGFTKIHGGCYKLVQEKVTQHQAMKKCAAINAILAEPSSGEVCKHLIESLWSSTQNEVWIGGSDAAQEDMWIWSTGRPIPYKYWDRFGNPNNNYGNEDCLALGPAGWNDLNCGFTRPYLCHMPENDITCPSDFGRYGTSCYKHLSEALPWHKAKETCEKEGFLAEPKSQSEYVSLETWMTNNGIHGNVWLGGKGNPDGVWHWVSDGEPFSYKAWVVGEPNMYKRGKTGCLQYKATERGWSDTSCEMWIEQESICQIRDDVHKVTVQANMTNTERGRTVALTCHYYYSERVKSYQWFTVKNGIKTKIQGIDTKNFTLTTLPEPRGPGRTYFCAVILYTMIYLGAEQHSMLKSDPYTLEIDECLNELEQRQRVGTPEEQVLWDKITDGGDWMVFQRRSSDHPEAMQNFNKTWPEYKVGFGSQISRASGSWLGLTHFWLGLDKIHDYCGKKSDNCELRVDMVFNMKCYHATYGSFYIEDETNKYRLHVKDFTGTAEDSLLSHDGMAFSTWDRDNDPAHTTNCAKTHAGGWWYNSRRVRANLNGRWKTSEYAKGMIWYTLTGYRNYVTFSEMKMRKGADSLCNAGFVPGPTILICYRLEMTPKTWQAAQDRCKSLGLGKDGKLAQAKHVEQNTAIASLQRLIYMWIGGRKQDGVLKWGQDNMEWTNWNPKQLLASYQERVIGNCLYMDINVHREPGTWWVQPCNTSLPYVCQHDAMGPKANHVMKSSTTKHAKSDVSRSLGTVILIFYHLYMD